MANKRKEDRFVERNNVSIKPWLRAKNGIGINGYTGDISLGGAKIFTKAQFYVGSPIKLQIELTGTGKLITLEGEVKWLKLERDGGLFELGVEFRHRISNSLLCLIKHIYQDDSRIPASVA